MEERLKTVSVTSSMAFHKIQALFDEGYGNIRKYVYTMVFHRKGNNNNLVIQ